MPLAERLDRISSLESFREFNSPETVFIYHKKNPRDLRSNGIGATIEDASCAAGRDEHEVVA